MIKESFEDYLGGIYRLREKAEKPLPLSRLQSYFGFSRVSVHEMIQKLAEQDLVIYHPYQGVTLTAEGEGIAKALLRRHRLWERFLTDTLGIPWDEAHEVAERLEHVAPEKVTERLAAFLGDPQYCPHGGATHPGTASRPGTPLPTLEAGSVYQIVRIAPESPDILQHLHDLGLSPESCLRVVAQRTTGTLVRVGQEMVELPERVATAVWVAPAKIQQPQGDTTT